MKRALAALLVLALLGAAGFVAWRYWGPLSVRLTPDRCTVANAEGDDVSLTAEQSRMASIIVAASYEAELPERAAVIALTTAYQESGIRNLDHGDRDSLGLFQQRPDPRFEWGTAEQIMDPWYSSLRFYEELVKFPDWETEDINDQAQKVQRSGFPLAYRKHVPNATALAAATRGRVPEAVSCAVVTDAAPDPAPIVEVLGPLPDVEVTAEGDTVRISAESDEMLWSAVNLAMLNTHAAGITKVQVGEREWSLASAAWHDGEPVDGAVITLG